MTLYKKPRWTLDVVLVVAVRNEYQAVLDWIAQLEKDAPQSTCRLPESELGAADLIFETLLPSGLILRYHIYKLPYPSMGSDATTFITTKAIYTVNPFIVCMIGICAGDPKRTKLGDVIVASSTVRSDFGKVVDWSAGQPWWRAILRRFFGGGRGVKLIHRISANRQRGMDGSIFRLADFVKIVSEYNKVLEHRERENKDSTKTCNRVRLGIVASGSQIVKVKGAFDYLRKNGVELSSGDEDERTLLALEMEAHSLAYAANLAENVGWLVIKGVVDYADGDKSDIYHGDALGNTVEFLRWMLPRMLEHSFERTGMEIDVTKRLDSAREYWEEGNIEAATQLIDVVYSAGIRTQQARKLRIKCTMRGSGYGEALALLEKWKRRPWFRDAITTELVAEIYWRQGDYDSMGGALQEYQGEETTQLSYQRALYYVFAAFKSNDLEPVESMLKKAQSSIDKAIAASKTSPRFFYNINQFFIYSILYKHHLIQSKQLEDSFETALEVTTNNLHGTKTRGLIYVYYLLLLALANKRKEFDEFAHQHQETDVVLSLDNVDMVYKRIDLLYADDSDAADWFLTKLTKFVRTKRSVGQAVRGETRGRLDRYK